jgi:hypothetical protein
MAHAELNIPRRIVRHHMMNALTDRDAECLLHQFRAIACFVNLTGILFLDIPLQFIPSVINVCTVCFSDKDILTDDSLTVSRTLT